MPQNLLPFGGEMLLFENCFTQEESDYYFQTLQSEINWKHEPIIFFGKEVMQPRLTAMYGEDGVHYAYSGIDMPTTLWTDTLKTILQRVSSVSQAAFNIALLNLYRDGNDSVSWR
jgi:alkylated DNA repair dioxygenase AlkB